MQDYMNEASCGREIVRGMEASRNIGTNIDKFPIAMAYVPWQKFDRMYDDLEKGYCNGTVFPELNKPFTGRRCV